MIIAFNFVGFIMHKNKTKKPKITCERIAALKKLAKTPDESIDYSDIPPITDFTGWTRLPAKKKICKNFCNIKKFNLISFLLFFKKINSSKVINLC